MNFLEGRLSSYSRSTQRDLGSICHLDVVARAEAEKKPLATSRLDGLTLVYACRPHPHTHKKRGFYVGFIVLYVDQLYQVPWASNTIYFATDVSDWSVCVFFFFYEVAY